MITSILNHLQKFIILFLVTTVFFISFVLGLSHADASTDFDFSAQYQVGQRPFTNIAADFDNDGDIDLVTANDTYKTLSISILFNNGEGLFTVVSKAIPGVRFLSGTSADLDSDGDIDLILSHGDYTGGVTILLNDGMGVFTVDSVLVAKGEPHTIATADFDNDGDIDIATSNSYSFVFTIFLNNGSGKFILSSTPSLGHSSHGITSADFDSDGDIDLALAQATDDNVVIFTNNGSGSFTRGSTVDVILPFRIKSADFDNDGDIDIAAVSNQNHTVTILLNNGDSTFVTSDIALGNYPNSIEVGDINNDGHTDVVVAGGINKDLSILLNNGSGVFSIEKKVTINEYLDSLAIADFDNDDDIDLATTFGQADFYVAILLQVGSPNTAPILNLVGDQVVSEKQTLTVLLSADDLDGDSLTYSTSNLPAGAVFDTATGHFSWTPGYDDAGVYQVTFTVSDGILSDSESIEITVLDTNRAPALNEIGNKIVAEGESLEFAVSAIDLDGDNLTYSASNLPLGSTFDSQTGFFSWTPGFTQSGNYTDIEFTVTDDGVPMQLDTELITITVGNVNRPPVFETVSSKQVFENELLAFNVVATDSDGDLVTLSVSDAPSGSSFAPSTGVFSWTPTLLQEGVYVVTFVATDNGSPEEVTSLEVVITVGDNPTPTEQAEGLVTSVIMFDIPQNIENSYLANLQKVALFIEEGKVLAAINQVQAFINKLTQDYQSGRISEQLYESLLSAANNLLNDLEGN